MRGRICRVSMRAEKFHSAVQGDGRSDAAAKTLTNHEHGPKDAAGLQQAVTRPSVPGHTDRAPTNMLDENPYQPALFTGMINARVRFTTVLWWMIYLQPTVALALMYVCRTLTTVSLGRPPESGEHPESDLAHGVVHVRDLPAIFLILGTPILIPIALMWGFA